MPIPNASTYAVRYWLYLAAKLLLAGLTAYVLQIAVELSFPIPPPPSYGGKPTAMFMHDMGFTFAILAVWFTSVALFYLAVWDQRHRCRTCLRRLIMPINVGSWGNMLTFGRPQTEWICRYGHGTLRMDDLQITGKELPDWEPNDDNIWKELESLGSPRK